MEAFDTWLPRNIEAQLGTDMVDKFCIAIQEGLSSQPECFKHIWVNGSHYRTKEYDDKVRMTVDCIVTATFSQQSVSSRADANPVGSELNYVGYITDILSMTYGHLLEFNLLCVQWYRLVVEEDLSRGTRSLPHNAVRRRDESGFKVINPSALVSANEEPFVFVDQVRQAVLSPLEVDGVWSLVLPVDSKFSYVADLLDTRA